MKSNPSNKYLTVNLWRALTLSVFTASAITYSTNLPTLADSITYTAPSENQSASFSGEIPIKQIGPLLLPKAVVQFKDTDVNVLAVPDWLFDRSVVLAGALVNAQIDLQNKTGDLRGLVYFSEGEWLNNLASVNATDVVTTFDGEILHGRIRSRLDNGFAFKPESGQMRKVLFTEIKNINSPRAYIFTMPSGSSKVLPNNSSIEFDANTISFAPTFGHGSISKSARLPKSTLAGTEPGISNAQIGAMVGMNMAIDLAPAIVIPLVLNKGNETAALNQIRVFNARNNI